jgi:hypothetical protein
VSLRRFIEYPLRETAFSSPVIVGGNREKVCLIFVEAVKGELRARRQRAEDGGSAKHSGETGEKGGRARRGKTTEDRRQRALGTIYGETGETKKAADSRYEA